MFVNLLIGLLSFAEKIGEGFFWLGLIIILVIFGGMLVVTAGTGLYFLFFT